MPFDWRTKCGYFFVITFEAIICLAVTYPCKSTLCFLIGSFWALLTIVEDIANDLNDLNARRREFNAKFYNVVHQFSSLKKLSDMKIIFCDDLMNTNIHGLFGLQACGKVQHCLWFNNFSGLHIYLCNHKRDNLRLRDIIS